MGFVFVYVFSLSLSLRLCIYVYIVYGCTDAYTWICEGLEGLAGVWMYVFVFVFVCVRVNTCSQWYKRVVVTCYVYVLYLICMHVLQVYAYMRR